MSGGPRAVYSGPAPQSYFDLNPWLPSASRETGERQAIRAAEFRAAATTDNLSTTVKVVPLPEPLPPELSRRAIAEMESLRDREGLTALRGDRPTDLARPHAGAVAARHRDRIAALAEMVGRIEAVLDGGPLFVRALKLDRARVSSTSPSRDRLDPNLHFDAEKSSLSEYSEPIFQFYLNAGRRERQFRIVPVALAEMFDRLAASEPDRPLRDLPLEEILSAYLDGQPDAPLEWIPVPSGHLTLFDGRAFAHDAGKCDPRSLAEGRFEPADELDFVVALDTVETGHHLGLYHPEIPFFEDQGE